MVEEYLDTLAEAHLTACSRLQKVGTWIMLIYAGFPSFRGLALEDCHVPNLCLLLGTGIQCSCDG